MSKRSAADHGTAYQLSNLIGRSNVVTKPKKNMNACEDFLLLILRSYITAAGMEVLGLKEVDAWPSSIPKDVWLDDKDKRQKFMNTILSSIVDNFVDVKYNTSHTISASDQVLTYTKQFFSIGCLYLEFSDAIKEGDGERVLHCWKYFLVIFHNSNRRNYAKEAVHLVYQYHYLLSLQQAEQFLFNRFINTSGVPGRNISADLFMEHLNRELKSGIADLGSGKTEKAILRLGKAIGTVAPVLHQFEEVGNVKRHETRHKAAAMKNDLLKIVNHINQYKVFSNIPGRSLPSFPRQKSLLHKQGEDQIFCWMKTHI